MIEGIGIDLIELDRIRLSMQENNRLVKRVLTEREQSVFFELQSERRKLEFLAGRFATKEAFAKASGRGIGKLSFQHMEVLPSLSGAPIITVCGYEKHKIFVSITHTEQYAAAQVVIEKVE